MKLDVCCIFSLCNSIHSITRVLYISLHCPTNPMYAETLLGLSNTYISFKTRELSATLRHYLIACVFSGLKNIGKPE